MLQQIDDVQCCTIYNAHLHLRGSSAKNQFCLLKFFTQVCICIFFFLLDFESWKEHWKLGTFEETYNAQQISTYRKSSFTSVFGTLFWVTPQSAIFNFFFVNNKKCICILYSFETYSFEAWVITKIISKNRWQCVDRRLKEFSNYFCLNFLW